MAQAAQAALWGFWRGLLLEKPLLAGGIIDLPTADASADELIAEIANAGAEHQIALRKDERYVPRVVAVEPSQLTRPATLHSDATYLITGGLGGIGICLANWMVEQGATRLVLTGRRDLPPRDAWENPDLDERSRRCIQQLLALEAKGASIQVAALDMADAGAVERVIADIQQGRSPLKGVIHAAGVSLRTRVDQVDWESFQQMAAPKILGGWHLHLATQALDLDFFTAISSVAAAYGSVQLAHYGAVNAFLDGLGALRLRQGLPASIISWGPWAEVGMVADAAERGEKFDLAATGICPMDSKSAVSAFAALIGTPLVHTIVAKMDWPRYCDLVSQTSLASYFEQITPPTARTGGAESSKLAKELRAMPPTQGQHTLQAHIASLIINQLQLADTTDLDRSAPFPELGVDSLVGVDLCRSLGTDLALEIPAVWLYQHASIQALTDAVMECLLAEKNDETAPAGTAPIAARYTHDDEIAIIGMGGRFPGADSIEAFWELLAEGRSAVGPIKPGRWNSEGMASRTAAMIDDVSNFDSMFFGISPREARAMDPQQRIFLEVAWSALEQAGYSGTRLCRETGIFVGCEQSSYAEHYLGGKYYTQIREQLAQCPEFNNLPESLRGRFMGILTQALQPGELTPDAVAGTGINEIASRLSHFLDLTGPSMAVNTACSSSIVALDTACANLRSGNIRMAVVGGVHLNLSDSVYESLVKIQALSPSGRCAPFDSGADGMVLGEGIGAVVLKPLSQAIEDCDYIHAVIKATSINNDGHSQGITAPNPKGQAAVIRQAYEKSGIDPRSISYIEAHGTGTPLGDPIEIDGLTRAFHSFTKEHGFCQLGSVKSSIGHMLAASGIGGLIKLALALEHKQIPPTVNFTQHNRHLNLEESPFRIAAQQLQNWHHPDGPRRAGLNAFGFGGTNAHVILEEPPARQPLPETDARPNLLVLSAQSERALRRSSKQLHDFLLKTPLPVTSICANKSRNQRSMPFKAAIVVKDATEMLDALKSLSEGSPNRAAILGRSHPTQITPLCYEAAALKPKGFDTLIEHFPIIAQAYEKCLKTGYGLPERQLHPFAAGWALASQFAALEIKPSTVITPLESAPLAAAITGGLSLEEALRCYCRSAPGITGIKSPITEAVPFPHVEQIIAPQGIFSLPTESSTELHEWLQESPRKEVQALPYKKSINLFTSEASRRLWLEPAKGIEVIANHPATLLNAVGRLYVEGARPDLSTLTPNVPQVMLPTYPFEPVKHELTLMEECIAPPVACSPPPGEATPERDAISDLSYELDMISQSLISNFQ
ncbi:SDR family NAD(P)-dependent oxidoreductase [Pseudomonadota bacterium]